MDIETKDHIQDTYVQIRDHLIDIPNIGEKQVYLEQIKDVIERGLDQF